MTIALVALILAGVSLAWNVFAVLIRYPRLSVITNKSVHITTDPAVPNHYVVQVIAINTGSEAITIADVSVRSADFAYSHTLSLWEPSSDETPPGPELPARIEPHGSQTWRFDSRTRLESVPEGTDLYGVVSRYRPDRRWPKPKQRPLKEYVSLIPTQAG